MHECGSNRAVMYSWPEFIAGKGSNEVVSCLDNFFCSLPEEVTSLYLYSDGCPGQNKNLTVMQYLFTLVYTSRYKLIQHHFPVHGHSFLPNDKDNDCQGTNQGDVLFTCPCHHLTGTCISVNTVFHQLQTLTTV